jgi:integrase
MGHSNTEMLFKVYSKYVPNLTRKDGSAFENFLGDKLEERGKKGREVGDNIIEK